MNSGNSERLSNDRFVQLMGRARSGDREALGELIFEYRDYLLLIAGEGLGRDVQAKLGPSDIVQQSMLSAQNKLDQFRGDSEPEFRAWIRQIVKNDLLDTNRKFLDAKRRQIGRETSLDDSRQLHAEMPGHFNTPRTDALVNEQAQLLRSAMSELPKQYQQVLQLRNWQDFSFPEIGRQMDCSPDAARKLWYRAVIRLQETFQKQNPGMNSSIIQSMEDDGNSSLENNDT